jgi:hypothetical protein
MGKAMGVIVAISAAMSKIEGKRGTFIISSWKLLHGKGWFRNRLTV